MRILWGRRVVDGISSEKGHGINRKVSKGGLEVPICFGFTILILEVRQFMVDSPEPV